MAELNDKKLAEIASRLNGYSPEQQEKIMEDIKKGIDVDGVIDAAFSKADAAIEGGFEAAKQKEIAESVVGLSGNARANVINRIESKYAELKAKKKQAAI